MKIDVFPLILVSTTANGCGILSTMLSARSAQALSIRETACYQPLLREPLYTASAISSAYSLKAIADPARLQSLVAAAKAAKPVCDRTEPSRDSLATVLSQSLAAAAR